MKRDRHLPAGMYLKHGTYYLVRRNKWQRLGATLAESLQAYARIVQAPDGSMQAALNIALADIRKRGAANTIRQYEAAARKIGAAFAEFTPDQVQPRHVAQFLDHMADTPNMANRCRSVLLLTFQLAVRAGLVDRNPVIEVKPFAEARRKRYVTDDEFARLYAAAAAELQIIMALCYLTGQRIGDVLKMRHADCQDDGIHVEQQKTDKRLVIGWSDDLRAATERARQLRAVRSFWLVAQPNGKPYSYFAVRDRFRRLAAKAGVADVTLHDLRAKSITDAKAQGLNPQLLAGHSDARMTERYIRQRQIDVAQGPVLRRSKTEAG